MHVRLLESAVEGGWLVKRLSTRLGQDFLGARSHLLHQLIMASDLADC